MKKATTEYFLNIKNDTVKITVQEDYIPKDGKHMTIAIHNECWRTKEETINLLQSIIEQLNKFEL